MVGEGNGNPLQYSCLENPMDGGAWLAAVRGVTKSRARLSDFTFTFHFHALEKEIATHSSIVAWRIPGTGEPSGLPSLGSHRVGHDWSNLAAAAARWWCAILVLWFHARHKWGQLCNWSAFLQQWNSLSACSVCTGVLPATPHPPLSEPFPRPGSKAAFHTPVPEGLRHRVRSDDLWEHITATVLSVIFGE